MKSSEEREHWFTDNFSLCALDASYDEFGSDRLRSEEPSFSSGVER
jgi:hypothetical protein